MKITYPSGFRNNPFDRNPNARMLTLATGAIAPHTDTQRILYNVPTGKRMLVSAIYVEMLRDTVATTPGVYMVYVVIDNLFGGGEVLRVRSRGNTVGDTARHSIACQLLLNPLDNIQIWTRDGSTGGLVDYVVDITTLEYDI
ncbi:MAG: hypothetical protein ROW48_18330 [Bellilinea sp.]|jgi:hypothetical protein